MPFQRSDEYMGKIVMDALDKEVILDAKIEIARLSGKLKAYCVDTKTFVQFPRDLREPHETFVADVIKQGGDGRTVYYRAYKGSIRKTKTGPVVA